MHKSLKFTSLQKKICDLILKTFPPGKHSARNAINHIKKAWILKDIDPDMAAFRAITAEEEAATAIFHSLKRRRYKGANLINHRNHVHKAAVFPFFWAISSLLKNIQGLPILDPRLEVDNKSTKPNFMLRLTFNDGINEPFYIYPEPPLNWTMNVNGIISDFSDQLNKIAEEKNVISINKYIEKNANIRNIILYASDRGIPTINSPIDKFLKAKTEGVFLNLTVFLLIDPYQEHQSFVQQGLNAFLKMLGKLHQDHDCD